MSHAIFSLSRPLSPPPFAAKGSRDLVVSRCFALNAAFVGRGGKPAQSGLMDRILCSSGCAVKGQGEKIKSTLE